MSKVSENTNKAKYKFTNAIEVHCINSDTKRNGLNIDVDLTVLQEELKLLTDAANKQGHAIQSVTPILSGVSHDHKRIFENNRFGVGMTYTSGLIVITELKLARSAI